MLCLPRPQRFRQPEARGCTLPGCGAPFPSPASGPGSQRFCALSRGAPRLFPPQQPAQAARGSGALSPDAVRLFPPQRAAREARGLAHSPRAQRSFSLRGPSPRRRWGLRKSSDRNRGLFAGWEGVASMGLSLPLAPPPASFLQRGWGSSLEFLSPFVLRTAGGVFRQVNFSSLSHSLKKLPPTALGAFWPVPTLSNTAGSSPFRPHLLVAGAGVWDTFLLGVAFRHLICGPYLIFPPS